MTRDTLLILTTSYPEVGDGSEAAGAFVADIAAELAKHVQVRVVAPGSGEKSPGTEVPAVWRFAGAGRPLSLLSPANPGDWTSIFKVLRSLRRQANAAAADGRVGHTIAMWALPSGWAARELKRVKGIPYTIWALGSDIWKLGRLPVVSTLLRRVIADADHCFADGLQLAEDAGRLGARTFDFLPSTRRTLPAGSRMTSELPPWRLLFVGRWHPNKGVDLLLDGLALLPEATWAAIEEVTIAGGGPMEQLVKAKVEELTRNGRPIRLLGFLSASEVGHEINMADWLVIPSRIESIPVVLSDALKANRPVIATAVGDMARIVEGPPSCGIVAVRPDADAIALSIVEAMGSSPARFSAGVTAAAANFDLPTVAARILSAIHGERIRGERTWT